MARIVEVVVSPAGETTVQTKGYAGAECQLASKWLADALGVTTSDQKTTEYFSAQANQQEIQH
jgi:Protein of unknown function (DUF2997)